MTAAPAKPDLGERLFGFASDLFGWLRTDSTDALIAVAIAVSFCFLVFGLRWSLVRLLGEGHPVTNWRGFSRRIVKRTRSPFIAALSAYLVIHVVETPGLLSRAVDVVFVIAFAVQGALWVREVLLALVERRTTGNGGDGAESGEFDSAVNIIRVLVNVVVWLLALILILDNLGVNVTALVAGLGVGGIAIGLAAQGIFSDLFAALSILFDRPFKVGDTIRFGEVTGSVEAIGLKTTRLRAITGEQVIVSNTKLLDQQIRNLRRIEARTTVMTFHLDLASDGALLAAVPAMLSDVVTPMSHVEFRRAHIIAVTLDSIQVEMEFTVGDASLLVLLATKQQVLLGALDGFRTLGVNLAASARVAAPVPAPHA
jgi:small-conductance mechanosensitive channel